MSERSRNWFLTINNYSDDELQFCKQYECDYKLLAEEQGEQGTPHIHLYIENKLQKSFKKMKKEFPRANIQAAKGNAQHNKDYLSKQKLILEEGIPKHAGKRTDLDDIKDILKETNKMREVVLVANSYQSVKMAEQILKYHEEPRNWKPEVLWFHGQTGTGKSKLAYEMCEEPYTCLSTGRWFDGYDSHEDVIIDDMRKDFMKFHELLRLLDRYAMKVETKGGSRQFRARRIIITSCHHPTSLYDTREDIQQLLRRIDEIKIFT